MRKPIGKIKNDKLARKIKRKLSTRKTLSGTASRPRVCTVKTNKNLSVQVIDDDASKTFFSFHTFGKAKVGGRTREGAKELGSAVAKKMKDAGLEEAVFDRNGGVYHGVVAAVAEGLREGGIRI